MSTTAATVNFFVPSAPEHLQYAYQTNVGGAQLIEAPAVADVQQQQQQQHLQQQQQQQQQQLRMRSSHTPYLSSSSEMSGGYGSDVNAYSDGAMAESQYGVSGAYQQQLAAQSLPPPFNMSPPRAPPHNHLPRTHLLHNLVKSSSTEMLLTSRNQQIAINNQVCIILTLSKFHKQKHTFNPTFIVPATNNNLTTARRQQRRTASIASTVSCSKLSNARPSFRHSART